MESTSNPMKRASVFRGQVRRYVSKMKSFWHYLVRGPALSMDIVETMSFAVVRQLNMDCTIVTIDREWNDAEHWKLNTAVSDFINSIVNYMYTIQEKLRPFPTRKGRVTFLKENLSLSPCCTQIPAIIHFGARTMAQVAVTLTYNHITPK